MLLEAGDGDPSSDVVTDPNKWFLSFGTNIDYRYSYSRKAIVYARINQQSEAHNAGKEILPLEFILFGNPKAGGMIMAENPIAALDLPLKIIAWQDAEKSVWVAYNSASYLEERYALSHDVIKPADLDPLINSVISKT